MKTRVVGSDIEIIPEVTEKNIVGILITSSNNTLEILKVVVEDNSKYDTLLKFKTNRDGHYIVVLLYDKNVETFNENLVVESKLLSPENIVDLQDSIVQHYIVIQDSLRCLLRGYSSNRCKTLFDSKYISVALLIAIAKKSFEVGDYKSAEEALSMLYDCNSPCLLNKCQCYE